MNIGESEVETFNGEEPVGDASIMDLVPDESKAKGMLLFRMAESTTSIVIHESIKGAIEDAGITGVKYTEPEEFVSL